MEKYRLKIQALSALKAELVSLKAEGKKIVFTNGCFDILHPGHLRYLYTARQLGDFLIIGLNSDQSVKMLKGPERPIIGQAERAEMLAALESRGERIGVEDLLIASTALTHGLAVATRNVKHLSRVDGLVVESWWS